MKYQVKLTARFRKDYKLMQRRAMNMSLLDEIIALLANGQPLPQNNRDHELTGDYAGHRECHVTPDWLLVYRIEESVLVLTLTRTGTHSDLF